jgi:hypothetical protein
VYAEIPSGVSAGIRYGEYYFVGFEIDDDVCIKSIATDGAPP